MTIVMSLKWRTGDRAIEHPVTVIVDETTGNKYMRMVDHKGFEGEGYNTL